MICIYILNIFFEIFYRNNFFIIYFYFLFIHVLHIDPFVSLPPPPSRFFPYLLRAIFLQPLQDCDKLLHPLPMSSLSSSPSPPLLPTLQNTHLQSHTPRSSIFIQHAWPTDYAILLPYTTKTHSNDTAKHIKIKPL